MNAVTPPFLGFDATDCVSGTDAIEYHNLLQKIYTRCKYSVLVCPGQSLCWKIKDYLKFHSPYDYALENNSS